MIVGILGGIASGKSTVAGLFRAEGCRSVDADAIGHEVLRDPAVKEGVRRLFGDDVFDDAGAVDRAALAKRVFGERDRDRVAQLNALTHPLIQDRIRAVVARHRADLEEGRLKFPETVLILDVSLLASSPLREQCDTLVFVEAPYAERRRRARERGWSDDELRRRESHQRSIDEKRRLASRRIDNSGELAATRADVRAVLGELERTSLQSAPSGDGGAGAPDEG
jgi:dephospho-CoA kinase